MGLAPTPGSDESRVEPELFDECWGEDEEFAEEEGEEEEGEEEARQQRPQGQIDPASRDHGPLCQARRCARNS